MNEETLNAGIRRFLKKVGIQSQQAIDTAIHQAVERGELQGNERLNAVMHLNIDELDLELHIDGVIALE